MIRKQLRCLWALFGAPGTLLWLLCHSAVSTADAGVHKQHRIVTLAPHLAEVVFAAGAGGHLIGVISGTDYPLAATKIPVVGGVHGIDFEKLVMLEPTMVLGWENGTNPADIAKLQSLDIPVRILRSNRLVDIYKQIIDVGDMFDSSVTAAANANIVFERILKLSLYSSTYNQKNIFVQIWDKPIFMIGREHLINEGLALCGARNVGEGYPFIAGSVSVETVLLSGADSILDLTGNWSTEISGSNSNQGRYIAAYIPVFMGDADLLMRPGPRFLDGLDQLCMQLRENTLQNGE